MKRATDFTSLSGGVTMSCQTRGCSNAKLAGCDNWGLSPAGVCGPCYEQAKNEIRSHSAGLAAPYVEDYAKVFLLLSDKGNCDRYLVALNAELATLSATLDFQSNKPAKHAADPQYIRLSRALDHFEEMCWFPTCHLIPLGLLSTAHFLHYIRLGYVLKDYGAGIRHGEFTHRLQWQIISRANTANYHNPVPTAQGWNKTPLDLYVTLGKPETRIGDETLWAFLLDRPGSGETYHYPDVLHKAILANATVPVLVANLSRRERKRRDEFVAEYKQQITNGGVNVMDIPSPTNHDEFYAFTPQVGDRLTDKFWADNPFPVAPPVKPVAKGTFSFLTGPSKAEIQAAKDQQNAAQSLLSVNYSNAEAAYKKGFRDRTTDVIGDKYKATKAGQYAPDALLPGGVQKLVADAPHDQAAVDVLVGQSYSGFQ